MNKSNTLLTIILIVAIAAAMYFYFDKPEQQIIHIHKKSVDTVYKVDTTKLIVVKPVLKTIYKNKIDTIFVDKAFEKIIDTTISNVKINASYSFPADTFRVSIQNKIAEIIRTDTVFKEIYTHKITAESNNYKYFHAGIGLIGGIILGVIIAK